MPLMGVADGADVDSETLTYSVTENGMYGSLVIDEMGAWTYTVDEANEMVNALNEGDALTDTLTIEVSDGQTSTTAMATFTIMGANDAPTLSDAAADVAEDSDMPLTGTADGADVDSETLTYSVTENGMYGSLVIDEMGAWTYTVDEANEMVNALNEGDTLTDTLTIEVSDGQTSTTAMATFTIMGANDAPTLSDAAADIAEDSDMPLMGTADGADVDSETLTYSVAENGMYGSLVIDEMGAWTYTVDEANEMVNALNVGDSLTDTLTIEVSDGQTSTTAMATFTIMGANDAPTLSDAAADIAEDSDMPLMGTADGADVDSETLTYSVAENGMYGSLVIDEMGAWTYTVDEANEMVNALNEGDTLTDTLTIEVSDGQTSTTAMATFTIMGANDAPVSVSIGDGVTPDGMMVDMDIAENMGGPVGEITVEDPDDSSFAESSFMVSDDRFEVKMDSEGGFWLVVREGGFDYETEQTVDVTVTVTDSGGLMATSDTYTVNVMNVDEPVMAVREQLAVHDNDMMVSDMSTVFAHAEEQRSVRVVLSDMFQDPEDAPQFLNFSLQNAPDWFTLGNIQVADNGDVTADLVSAPGQVVQESRMVTLVAEDRGGSTASVEFELFVDNGNDMITEAVFQPSGGVAQMVPEDVMGGYVLGQLVATDADDARTENGTHEWFVDDPDQARYFEAVQDDEGNWFLEIRDGAPFDFENENIPNEFRVGLTVRETNPLFQDEQFQRKIFASVEITNVDEPTVRSYQPGNWWAAIDEELDEDDVQAGDWLSFYVRGDIFADQDAETLTLSLDENAPSWLEYEYQAGDDRLLVRNRAEMIAERGVYDITVVATDPTTGHTSSATASFRLAVAIENDEPNIMNETEIDIDENSPAGTLVGTFDVSSGDFDLQGLHPYGMYEVDHTVMREDGRQVFSGLFAIELVESDNPGVARFEVRTTEDLSPDHEINEEFEIEITVRDAAGASDTDSIKIDIDDVDEAPVLNPDFTFRPSSYIQTAIVGETPAHFDPDDMSSGEFLPAVLGDDLVMINVFQAGDPITNGQGLYAINLTQLITDPEGDDDVTFSLSVNAEASSWLKIIQDPIEFDELSPGMAITADFSARPDDDDYIAIIEVVRSPESGSISSDLPGMITVTATDDDGDGVSGTMTIGVNVFNDLNYGAGSSEALTFGRSTLFQYDTINFTYDFSVDPDLRGTDPDSPVLVVYGWSTDDDVAGDLSQYSLDSPESFAVTQDHVDGSISGHVQYYEVARTSFGSAWTFVRTDATRETGTIQEVQDAAVEGITFETTTDDFLVANAMVGTTILDMDGTTMAESLAEGFAPVYTWQFSENPEGDDWEAFEVIDSLEGDGSIIRIPIDKEGDYIRLVVEFMDDEGRSEQVTSDAIKVGKIDTLDLDGLTPTRSDDVAIDLRSGFVNFVDDEGNLWLPSSPDEAFLNVGATLQIMAPQGVEVQWYARDLDGANLDFPEEIATGREFTITEDQAGKEVFAVVTQRDGNGAITSRTAVDVLPSNNYDFDAVRVYQEDPDPGPRNTNVNVFLGSAVRDDESDDPRVYEFRGEVADGGLASLFVDPDDQLTFEWSAGASGFTKDDVGGGLFDVWKSPDDSTLVFLDEQTGHVRFITAAEFSFASGNQPSQSIVALELTATDSDGSKSSAITVTFRVDREATGYNEFSADRNTIMENVPGGARGTEMGGVDIDDINDPTLKYGGYTWRVVNDDRFDVVADSTDSSMATLVLKRGATLDYETDFNTRSGPGTYIVELEATPVDSAESGFEPIEIDVRVTITNDPTDDPVPNPDGAVPGLDDDENPDPDEREDDGTDDDDDAGTEPMFVSILDDGMIF